MRLSLVAPKPMIPEGELLHYIDMIDARMYDMSLALKDVASGEFSDPVWVLDKEDFIISINN